MPHTKFQGHRTFGFGEDFKGFRHMGATAILVLCLDHSYELLFPVPMEAPHEIWLWFKQFLFGNYQYKSKHIYNVM